MHTYSIDNYLIIIIIIIIKSLIKSAVFKNSDALQACVIQCCVTGIIYLFIYLLYGC